MYYVCQSEDLHELSGIVFGHSLWLPKDRKLFPLEAVAQMAQAIKKPEGMGFKHSPAEEPSERTVQS